MSSFLKMQSSEVETLEDTDLCWFDNQISGHSCLLKGTHAPQFVYKPYDCNEADFYEFVSQDKEHPLTDFIPSYYGLYQLPKQKLEDVASHGFAEEHSGEEMEWSIEAGNSIAETNHNSYSDSPENLSGSKEDWFKALFKNRFNESETRFLKLQDLTSDMENPCILDLKMGSVAYNPKKLAHQIAKFGKTTSASLKFRVCGLQVKNPKTDTSYFKDKYWGRKVDIASIKNALALFFFDGHYLRRSLINCFIWKLQGLAAAIKACPGYKFYSVSLLLIYDSTIDEERFDSEEKYQLYMKDKVKVNLIDFAKTVRDKKSNEPDYDFLTGLENFITCLMLIAQDSEIKPLIA